MISQPRGYAPGLKLLELQRQRRSEAGEKDVAVAQQTRGIADARKFAAEASQAGEQAAQQALADLTKAQAEAMVRREDLAKAHERSRLQRLTAPVDGTVQQLAVHTIGGVVQSVSPLMIVVPMGALKVEAKLLNKDAGFVRPGQDVAVKLEAFPFTRYGTIPGRIVTVSSDAIDDKKLGPIYVARIALLRSKIDRGDAIVSLEPGESVTADIRTGQRSLFSYLLNPIEKAKSEAGRER